MKKVTTEQVRSLASIYHHMVYVSKNNKCFFASQTDGSKAEHLNGVTSLVFDMEKTSMEEAEKLARDLAELFNDVFDGEFDRIPSRLGFALPSMNGIDEES